MTELLPIRRVLRVVVEGPLLIGGRSAPPGDVDATTAFVEENGRQIPILTASGLKGALREAALLLERSEDGGARTPMSWERVQVVEDTAVQRIFGGARGRIVSPGPGEPPLEQLARDRGWMEQGVRVTDARPVGEPPALKVRHGVSIDRFTRARSRGRLFRKQVVEARAGGQIYEARITGWLRPEDLARLEDAARLVCRLGSGSSRGQGQVRMELIPIAEPEEERALVLPSSWPGDGELRVLVTALEPLHLGRLQNDGNVRETLDFIPGGALRGALVASARRAARAHPELQSLVERLWGEDFHASDLLPVADPALLPAPAPRTLLKEKRAPHRQAQERCLELALARALASEGHGVEDAILEPCEGRVGSPSAPRRLVTRLALDPATRGAAHGQLYVVEQMEPGVRLLGTLSGVSEEVRRALELLAESGEPIYIGGLRSRGLGRVLLRISSPPADDLRERVQRFQRGAREKLRGLEGLGWRPDGLLQVVARTPLAAPPGEEVGAWLARQLLGEGARVRGAWARDEVRSGWIDHRGKPAPILQVARAGSTWLLETDGELPWERLRGAERAGVGHHRELGLGRLLFCPSLP